MFKAASSYRTEVQVGGEVIAQLLRTRLVPTTPEWVSKAAYVTGVGVPAIRDGYERTHLQSVVARPIPMIAGGEPLQIRQLPREFVDQSPTKAVKVPHLQAEDCDISLYQYQVLTILMNAKRVALGRTNDEEHVSSRSARALARAGLVDLVDEDDGTWASITPAGRSLVARVQTH